MNNIHLFSILYETALYNDNFFYEKSRSVKATENLICEVFLVEV